VKRSLNEVILNQYEFWLLDYIISNIFG